MGLFDFISDACSTIADAASTVAEAVGDVATSAIDLAGAAVDYAVENPLTSIAAVTAVAATGGAALGAVAGTAVVTGASAGVMGLTAGATGAATGAMTGATIAGSTGLVTSAAVVATKTSTLTVPVMVAAQSGIAVHAIKHIGEYIIDEIKGRVTPVRGSVVYCDLTLGNGFAEHSGIYIGNNEIVHLNRHGQIEIVTPQQFISGATAGSEIYVSCEGEWAVGCEVTADFAESMVGSTRNYNVLIDNCHQFSAGCLLQNSENPNNFLWFLRDEATKRLGADNWRLWDKNYW